MMDQMAISESLKASGVECGRLQGAAPYCGGGPLQHRHSWIETGAAAGRDSLADIAAGTEPD
ncbi:hypothetical protein NL387_27425, partial [Klebsiella pneumoniae]|nr:hypothetical protein [Klebsiella pneumoniae]